MDLKIQTYLLPKSFRFLGIIFTIIGIVLGILRFYYGLKPKVLEQKIFALFSYYIERKTCVVVNNQILEEIVGLLLIIGLFFIAFSKEKNENSSLNSLRIQAFFLSFYINTILIIFSFAITFGYAFMVVAMVNLGSIFLIYYITFRVLKYRHTRDRV